MRNVLVILCLLLSAMVMQPAASDGISRSAFDRPRPPATPPRTRPPFPRPYPPSGCCSEKCCGKGCC